MEKRRKALVYALIEVIGFLVLMTPVLVNGYYSIQPTPAIPNNVPSELTLLQVYDVNSNMSDALIQYEPNGVKLQIKCSQINSIAGDWYGVDPNVTVNGKNVQAISVPDVIGQRWSESSGYADSKDVNPSLTTRIPLTASSIHQTLNIHVAMDVRYSDFTGETKRSGNNIIYYYYEPSVTVTRDLNLFVLTPQEMQLKENLNASESFSFFSENNFGYVILALLWLFPFGIVFSALTVASAGRRHPKTPQDAYVNSTAEPEKPHTNSGVKQIIKYSILGFLFFSAILIGASAYISLGPSINSAGSTFNYVCCFAAIVVITIGMFKGPKVGAAFGQASLIPFFIAQNVNHTGLLGMLYFGLLNCLIFTLFGSLPSGVFRAAKNLSLLAVSYIITVAVGFVLPYLFYANWQSIPILVSRFTPGLMTFFFESAANSMVFAAILNLIMGGAVVWACALSIDHSKTS
jgi:hypothetical protein